MFYHNIDMEITLKHSVIIKNWLLDKFLLSEQD